MNLRRVRRSGEGELRKDELGQWSVRDWLAAGEPVEPVLDLARGGVWPLMVDAAFPLQSTVPAPGTEDGVTWRPEQRL